MNSRVRCEDDRGLERELSLVYPWDAASDRCSLLGPLGIALLGRPVGTVVEVEGRRLTLTGVPYQPEAAGDHHL